MSYRMFDTAINDYIKNYQTVAGSPYDDKEFHTPTSVPGRLLDIVKSIKILRLEQRQFEIIEEIMKCPRAGDAFVVSDTQKHLLDEFDAIKSDIEKWSTS